MELVKELLRSKKFVSMVIGIAATIAAKVGLDAEVTQEIAAIVVAYIVGQGVADQGKERAKIEAQSVSSWTVG